MSDWNRSTREIEFDQLPIDMKVEIQKHIDQYHLGDILSDAFMCVQTDSEKAKKGLFGSVEMVQMGAVLTPRWLVWVVCGTKTHAAALSALLADVTMQDYADTQFFRLIPDSGIQVSGKFTDVSENASVFIGLENNIIAKKFKETLAHAVQGSKK